MTKNEPGQASALAKALQVTPQKISYYAKKSDAPLFFKDGKPNLAEWKPFLAVSEKPKGGPAGLADLQTELWKEKLMIATETRKAKERERMGEEGQSYDFEEIDPFMRQVASVFYSELERVFQEFPQTLVGKDQIAILAECEREHAIIADKVQARFDSFYKAHQERVARAKGQQ